MKIEDMIKKYVESCRSAVRYGEQIAEFLADIIRNVVSDIDWSVGWYEAGINTICFYSKSKDVWIVSKMTRKLQEETGKDYIECSETVLREKVVRLEDVIYMVFPELKFHIECPYGVYLTKEEAERLKKLLLEAKVMKNE